MQYVSRSVCWIGACAFVVWGVAVALIGFQAAGDLPAPIGVSVAIVASTLTIVAVAVARREREQPSRQPETTASPGREIYISSHALLDTGEITMEIPRMARVIPIQTARSGLSRIPDAIAGQLYRLGVTDARLGQRP